MKFAPLIFWNNSKMEQTKDGSTSDEIDLTQLFRWIREGFARFGRAIIWTLASLRRTVIDHKIFFVVILVLGATLGGLYSSQFEKKYYTSSMIISCDYLSMRIVHNMIGTLNLLCQEGDRSGLAEVLKVGVDTAQNIGGFSVKNFLSEKDRVEIEVMKEQLHNVANDKKELVAEVITRIEIGSMPSFMLSISVYDPEVVRTLEHAMVKYFRENEYVEKRIRSHEKFLLDRKAKLTRESRKLDSLKIVLLQNFQTLAKDSRSGSNNVILNDMLSDPLNVFKEDLDINNEIREIDQKLALGSDFEVVDGLTTFRDPDNASFLKVIALSMLASIVIGYLLLGIFRLNKFLATVEV